MNIIRQTAYVLIAFSSLLASCNHLPQATHEKLSLDSLQAINWSQIDKKNALTLLGTPDVQSPLGKDNTEEAWIFLTGNPPTTRLSLSFNTKTNQLVSVNWFANDSEPALDFSELQKKYPQMDFDLKNPLKDRGIHQAQMLFYSTKKKNLNAAVYEDTKKVSSLEWHFTNDGIQEKRKPTSH